MKSLTLLYCLRSFYFYFIFLNVVCVCIYILLWTTHLEFGIHSHKTLDTAQPCHLLKPN